MRIYWVLSWLAVSILVLADVSWAAESDVDRLLDLLVEKGVVTKDDAAGFRADLAVKKQEEKEKQKEFNVIAGKPIKIGGYTQLRYQFLEEDKKMDSFDTSVGSDVTDVSTFGVNWYFNKWAFLQVNYELKDEEGKEKDNNTLIGQLTLQF